MTSKELVAEVLKGYSKGRKISILDVGCGNAHLCGYFKEQKLSFTYTGVDFSDPLLAGAQAAYGADSDVTLVKDDVNELNNVEGQYDIGLYSHVIEMLGSPERSLLRARAMADRIIIRFFEPPEFDTDLVELRHMEVGDGKTVPYIRRKMSRDYYRLILTKMGCTHVDVYRDQAKDQVHVLHYKE